MVELKVLSGEVLRFRELFRESTDLVDIPTFIGRAFNGNDIDRGFILGTLSEAGLDILASIEGLEFLKSIFLDTSIP